MIGIAAIGVVVATAVARAIALDRVRAATPPTVEVPRDAVVERREISDPRGPLLLVRYADGRMVASGRVTTELEGGPATGALATSASGLGRQLQGTGPANGPLGHGATRLRTRDRAFDRVWAVRRGPACCTLELRREILGARPLVVRIEGGLLTVAGSAAWCREGALVEALRAIRGVLPRTELDGLRLTAVDDPIPEVRIRAWSVLVGEDTAAARAAMTAALWSGHPRIRMEAARRLGNDEVLVHVVADAFADPPIRRAALRSVNEPGALVSAIQVALAGADDDLRCAALERLADLEGSRALEAALRPWRDNLCADWSPDCQERHAAVTARLLRGPWRRELTEEVLLRFLGFGELRELALRGLCERGTAAVVARLRVLQHLDPGGADELERVVDAIRQRLGGAGALALAEGSGGALALAEPGAGGTLALDDP